VHQPFSVFHLVSRYLAPNPCRCGGILQRFDPSRPPVPLGPGQLRLPGQRRVALRQLHSGPLQCLLPALTQAKARTLTAQSLLGFETAGDPLRPDKNEPRVSDQLLEQDRLLAPVQDPVSRRTARSVSFVTRLPGVINKISSWIAGARWRRFRICVMLPPHEARVRDARMCRICGIPRGDRPPFPQDTRSQPKHQ
jgi:hypothetical protein